jgi:CBS-domain-containing membrane protein
MSSARALTVGDLMIRSVLSVGPGTSAVEIAQLLSSWAVGAVPVLDDAARLLGVVSGKDLLTAATSALRSRPVAMDIMTRDVVTVAPDMAVRDARALMVGRGMRWLPVQSGERVVGVLSRCDLLGAFLRPDPDIEADVLAALCAVSPRFTTDLVVTSVRDGVVSLIGRLADPAAIELAERAAAQVPGVVLVDNQLYGAAPHPALGRLLNRGRALANDHVRHAKDATS